MGIPTRYGAGVSLYGDYNDLKSVHATIHKLCDHHNVQDNQGDFILGLAYDVRKAYETGREKRQFGTGPLDRVEYMGARILWPYFLTQIAMLRHFASLQPTSAQDHACLYTLEHIAESTLQEQNAAIARYCIEWLRHFPGLTRDYLTEFINEQAWNFVFKVPPGKRRMASLPKILQSLHWFSNTYREFEKNLREVAKSKNCDPQTLEVQRTWPDFKW